MYLPTTRSDKTPPAAGPLELNGESDSGYTREQLKDTSCSHPVTTSGHVASWVPIAVLSQMSPSRIRVLTVPSGRSRAVATCSYVKPL